MIEEVSIIKSPTADDFQIAEDTPASKVPAAVAQEAAAQDSIVDEEENNGNREPSPAKDTPAAD